MHVMKVLQEHQPRLKVTLPEFAFQRAIGFVLIIFLSKHFGSFTLTNVIKIVLFVDADRKMLPYIQHQQDGGVVNNSGGNSLNENDNKNTPNSRCIAFAFIRLYIREIQCFFTGSTKTEFWNHFDL